MATTGDDFSGLAPPPRRVSDPPAIRAGSEPRAATQLWPRNTLGFVLASSLLHLGVVLAAMQVDSRRSLDWRLELSQGRNSVALQASIAATRSTPEPVRIVRPPLTDEQAIERPTAGNDVDLAAIARSDEAPMPVRPDGTEPETTTEPIEKIEPARLPRSEAELPQPAKLPPRESPAKRPTPAEIAPELVAMELNSVASASSAASSGVEESVAPEAVYQASPIYPPESVRLRESGEVVLWVRVDAAGRVVATEVHSYSGFTRLDNAALAAMRQFRFAPADKRARMRAAEFLWPFPFVLQAPQTGGRRR